MPNEKGQALVEAALIIPLLLLLVLGVFEYGRAMYAQNTLNNAVRAGARNAAVTPRYHATANPSGLQASATSALNTACTFTGANSSVYRTVCESITNGVPRDEVVVEIQAIRGNFNATEPLRPDDLIRITARWGNFQPVVAGFPVPQALTSEASMRYE